MDKIWDRESFEVRYHIGRCGGDEKTEWPRKTDISRTLKKRKKVYTSKYILLLTWWKEFGLYIWDVALWLACLTWNRWMLVRHEFDPHQRLSLFPLARNLETLPTSANNTQYWLVSKMWCHNQTTIYMFKLTLAGPMTYWHLYKNKTAHLIKSSTKKTNAKLLVHVILS